MDMDAAGGMMGGGATSRPSRRGRSEAARQLGLMQKRKAVAGRGAMMFESRDWTALGDKRRFYQELDSTKQWAESHFDQVRVVGGQSPIQLIPINAFWNDLANNEWDDEKSMANVSKHLLQCNNRHSEASHVTTVPPPRPIPVGGRSRSPELRRFRRPGSAADRTPS